MRLAFRVSLLSLMTITPKPRCEVRGFAGGDGRSPQRPVMDGKALPNILDRCSMREFSPGGRIQTVPIRWRPSVEFSIGPRRPQQPHERACKPLTLHCDAGDYYYSSSLRVSAGPPVERRLAIRPAIL